MVLRAFADTRSFTERPSASDITVTLSRLGRNRRLVLRFEWLTLCPTCAPLPVSSHRRDMAKSSLKRSGALPAHAASGRRNGASAPAGSVGRPRTYSGGGRKRQGKRGGFDLGNGPSKSFQALP